MAPRGSHQSTGNLAGCLAAKLNGRVGPRIVYVLTTGWTDGEEAVICYASLRHTTRPPTIVSNTRISLISSSGQVR